MRCHSVGCGTANQNAISNAIGLAKHRSRSHRVVIRVYDEAGKVIETHSTRATAKSGELCAHKQKAATR